MMGLRGGEAKSGKNSWEREMIEEEPKHKAISAAEIDEGIEE
jgi:hypothetical protein